MAAEQSHRGGRLQGSRQPSSASPEKSGMTQEDKYKIWLGGLMKLKERERERAEEKALFWKLLIFFLFFQVQ